MSITALMFKKVLLSIVIILPLLALYFSLFGTDSDTSSNPASTRTEFVPVYPSRAPATIPQTKLRFILENPRVTAKGTVEAEVFMDAFENNVTEVTLEIGYDPKVVQVLSVKPVDFLGGKKVTINAIDKINGKITFGAKVDNTQTPPLTGSDALLEVELKPINLSVPTTELTFLPGTFIKSQGIDQNAVVATESKQIALQ